MSASTRAPVIAPGTTIAAARRNLTILFRDAGIETPELDARLIVGEAVGFDHAALASHAERELSAAEAEALTALAARRRAHEPVARILGCKEFWSLDLVVTPAVLVPRPDTETVVEAALAVLPSSRSAWRIADIGVGSGAILLALMSELPSAFGVGTDRSLAALDTACINATRLDLDKRAAFVACDYGRALAGGLDLVVSNPPYIPTNHIATLAAEVRDFEPRAALDGGNDGLDSYRAIAADAVRLLAPGGALVLELGMGQMEAVSGLLTAAGLAVERPAHADLAGIPRALTARRSR
jgi:release factor glutamine methyltransferase